MHLTDNIIQNGDIKKTTANKGLPKAGLKFFD